MRKNEKQLNFRIDAELATWIKSHAKQNHRSVSAQLTLMIKQEKEYVSQTNHHSAN